MACVFCRIISGDLRSYKVYEDELFFAFLDINPIREGHTLVIPKTHCVNIFDTPEVFSERYYSVVQKLSRSVSNAMLADGVNVFQLNGSAAGQIVLHSHIHIVPRHKDDGASLSHDDRMKLEDEELKSICSRIIEHI